MRINVQFPISPWKNNYVIISLPFQEKQHYYPPTPIQNMIAYSYLEKLVCNDPSKVQYTNDAYSFTIKDEKVFNDFCNIIAEPLAKTIVTFMKEHELISIERLSEDQIFSTPLYTSFRRTVVEPDHTKLTEKAFFIIKCRKFSNNNPYKDKDVILSDICVMEKSDESYANFVLKVLDLMLSDKEETNDVTLWDKIRTVVEAYYSGNTWPITLLMLASAIYCYKSIAFFYLYSRSHEFREIFRVAKVYKGDNPEESEKKAIGKDFLNIVGLRGTLL